MKKTLLLLIGGVLFMTTVTGCFNVLNKKSKGDIEEILSDFTDMFPMKDYDLFYTKNITETIEEDEVGIWQISQFLFTKENEITSTGVNLSFNTQKKECVGNLFITKKVDGDEEESAYPLYYKDSQILFVDETVDTEVRKTLEEFGMLFELIDLNKEYLSSLKSTRHFYNYEVPLYGVDYIVDDSDKNIKSIKEHYPNLISNKDNIKIELDGKGTPWNHGAMQSLYILLDENKKNWFIASMDFTKIKIKDYIDDGE